MKTIQRLLGSVGLAAVLMGITGCQLFRSRSCDCQVSSDSLVPIDSTISLSPGIDGEPIEVSEGEVSTSRHPGEEPNPADPNCIPEQAFSPVPQPAPEEKAPVERPTPPPRKSRSEKVPELQPVPPPVEKPQEAPPKLAPPRVETPRVTPKAEPPKAEPPKMAPPKVTPPPVTVPPPVSPPAPKLEMPEPKDTTPKPARLSIRVRSDKGLASVGEDVGFTIELENSGGMPAEMVETSIIISGNLIPLTASPQNMTRIEGNRVVVQAIGSLEPKVLRFQVTAKVKALEDGVGRVSVEVTSPLLTAGPLKSQESIIIRP